MVSFAMRSLYSKKIQYLAPILIFSFKFIKAPVTYKKYVDQFEMDTHFKNNNNEKKNRRMRNPFKDTSQLNSLSNDSQFIV